MADLDIPKLLEELTLNEKVALLAGKDNWHTFDIPDKKIPSLRFSDGPNGLRGTKFFNSIPSACFPCGTAMGATFDHDLLKQAGELMAKEAYAKGAHVILGPTVNMQRSPLGGRGFESFSEDPVLSGGAASDVINGMQSKGIQATIKHFVGNDQEDDRRGCNAVIPQRALREIYLMSFQLALRDSKPACIMSAYNKVNGTHVAQDKKLLRDILRDEWKFDGLVMSDWFGTYSTVQGIQAHNNLEMPGPTIWRGNNLAESYLCREVNEHDLNANVEQVLKLVKKSISESGIPENANEGENNNAETSALLRKLAAESMVLLKNEDNVLPLKKDSTTAVIGPNAEVAAYCGGGSAALNAYYTVSPLEGITSKLSQKPKYALGVAASKSLPLIGEHLKTSDGKAGFSFKCFDGPVDDPNRKCVDEMQLLDSKMFFGDYNPDIGDKTTFYVDVEGIFTPSEDGVYEFGCIVNGSAYVYIDGEMIIDNATVQRQGTEFLGTGTLEEKGQKELKAGKEYKLTCKFGGASTSKLGKSSTVIFGGGLRLGVQKVETAEARLAHAVEAAKSCDQAVVIVGLTSEFESEGFDREHMDMPEGTDELVEQVLAANPNTVVVVQSGTPVTLNWTEKAKSIVQAWYGGNETGNGIADVLFGDVNPSAKLPLSYPRRVEDNPAFFNYKSENGVIVYGENAFVGYRYYEKIKRDVLYAFGHGLSYTTFKYGKIGVAVSGGIINASVEVTNSGKVAGKESVQFYVSQKNPSVNRPVKELKGYGKVDLAPGETKTVKVSIPLNYATSFWDDFREQWKSEKDVYEIHAASSSADVRSTASFETDKTFWWSGI